MKLTVLSFALMATQALQTQSAWAQTTFRVVLDPAARSTPAQGRLILGLIREGAKIGADAKPIDGPFWDDPQPFFGIDAAIKPGEGATIDDKATASTVATSQLPPGTYRAQARMRTNFVDSNWRREPGNLWSDEVSFTIPEIAYERKPRTVELHLSHVVQSEPPPKVEGVEWFEVRSKLLSDFRGRDVMLRAGVVLPAHMDPARKYPAIYEVPGFGGNHLGAVGHAHGTKGAKPDSNDAKLAAAAFYVVLDPEGPDGHTLFADSANNGPCGEALVKELIPALEAKYHLVAAPAARLLRGHSSGGWSTLWLAITYPETFGATWSTSPDPVDFRRFQLVDIYTQQNMYQVDLPRERSGEKPDPQNLMRFSPPDCHLPPLSPNGPVQIASFRAGGRAVMSNRTENLGEQVLGLDNTSGQQWDSWMAVFAPRNKKGHPAELYDPILGMISHDVAEKFRKYDIGERLRKDPVRIGAVLRGTVRVGVGDKDSFFLNEAVALLQKDLDAIKSDDGRRDGYVKILPGYDHGTIFQSPELRAFPAEMLAHLRREKLAE